MAETAIMAMTSATNPCGFAAEPDMTLKIRTQASKRNWTRSSGLTNAVPLLPDVLAISQAPATATMNTGTARIAATFGGPPRTSSAAITTRLPVTCAVNSPKFKNPITSTMPATALSNGGSRFCNRCTSTGPSCGEGCETPDCAVIAIVALRLGPRARGSVGQTIDDDLRSDDAEAHRQNDRHCRHPVGDRCTQEIQSRIRVVGKLQ